MRSTRVLSLVLLALVLGGTGCPLKYPACKTDDDCNRNKGEKDRREYCVNQLCQQCRSNTDCGKGMQCNKGRCDPIAGWCTQDSDCPADKSCIDNQCRACTQDSECGEGGHCRSGKCLRQGQCQTDDDCPEAEDCVNGMCSGGKKPVLPPPKECTLVPVYFDFNEYVLSTEATDSIDKNAACVKQVGRKVELVGRTDPRGTEEYNFVLSEKRAQQVRDRLQRLGIDAAKMHVLPKGELEATGKEEAGWAHDRRVDFEWQ